MIKDTESRRFNVKKLNGLSYLLMAGELKTPLSDYYVKQLTDDDEIIGCFREEELISYAIVTGGGENCNLKFIMTKECCRNQGAAGFLVEMLVTSEKGRGIIVNVSLSDINGRILAGILEKSGARVTHEKSVYTANTDEKMWKRMDEMQLRRMQQRFLRSNQCVSFREMPESIRMQLFDSGCSEYRNQLNPEPYLTNERMMMDRDLSFAMVKNGKLKAYTLIVRARKDTAIVENISTSWESRGSGAVVCPLCSTFNAIREEGSIKKIMMAIDHENSECISFTKNMLKSSDVKEKEIKTYCLPSITAASLFRAEEC